MTNVPPGPPAQQQQQQAQQQAQQQPQVPLATPPSSADDMLMSSGGTPNWSWAQKDPATGRKGPKPVNTAIKGIGEKLEVEQQTDYDTRQPLFWDRNQLTTAVTNQPAWKLVLTLRTDPAYISRENDDDDGLRRVHMKKGRAEHVALRDAIQAAGAAKFEPGAEITMWISDIQPNTDPNAKGDWPIVSYAAHYVSPAQGALMGGAQQAPAAPPAQGATSLTVNQQVMQYKGLNMNEAQIAGVMNMTVEQVQEIVKAETPPF